MVRNNKISDCSVGHDRPDGSYYSPLGWHMTKEQNDRYKKAVRNALDRIREDRRKARERAMMPSYFYTPKEPDPMTEYGRQDVVNLFPLYPELIREGELTGELPFHRHGKNRAHYYYYKDVKAYCELRAARRKREKKGA